jgi:hypothetical protein
MPIGVPDGLGDGQDTFLQICQRTVRECRIAQGRGLLPLTVLDQTGMMRKVVDWCAEAWFQIQALHDTWRMLRRECSFEVIDGQAEYTTLECGIDAGTFNRWILRSFRSYLTSVGLAGEIPMGDLPYDSWRNTYKLGTSRTTKSQPIYVTQLPNNGLGLGPTPLAGYTILGDFYIAPVRMEVDEDVPLLPIAHSHLIITYKAMMDFGLSESAPEVYGRGEKQYKTLLAQLERDQMPSLQLGGCLR